MNYSKTIYISHTGSDFNDGLTPSTPIKTLKLAAVKCSTDNTCLLFDGGGIYYGNLHFNNVNRLFIGSYGIGIPIIKPGNKTGIYFKNCNDIAVAKLKLEGEGFRICNKSIGISAENCTNLLVKNIEVSGFHIAGIHVGGCINTEVVGCFAHDNGAVGINSGSCDGISSENVRIAHCKVYDNAGDYLNRENHSGSGIIIGGTNHSVVEFCEATGNGWAQRQINVNGPVGIWCCCGCTDVVFRYNIARYNRTQPGAVDGDGLDIDGEVKDGVMEYNYTYGNEGSGYLLCEFWGDCSDTLWENNITRYCVSFEDDTRVPGYGAINMSSPVDIPFDKLYINDNLFVAHKDHHCIYNKNIPSTAKDMFITDNILVTGGTPTIHTPDHPYMTITGNMDILDPEVRKDIIAHAPLLSDPRELLHQPVFELLKSGKCYEALQQHGAKSLFKSYPTPIKAAGFQMIDLQMYGPDTDGCDKSGDVALYYDSIRPGVVTRLTGAGAEFYTPLPWWDKNKRYIVRATARLQSPHTLAYLFIRDENGKEKKAFFSGTVAEYNFTELDFNASDKWFDPGKYIGVKLVEGNGSLYVYSLEFIELAAEDAYTVDNMAANSLADFRSFGDCYQAADGIALYCGSNIAKTIQVSASQIQVKLCCETNSSDGIAYVKCGDKIQTSELKEGCNEITLSLETGCDIATIGINQNCGDHGIIKIKDVKILS